MRFWSLRGSSPMIRLVAVLACLCLAAPVAAQGRREVGQMRLYIQQLEEQVRQLTGENERLGYELQQLRAQIAQTGAAPGQAAEPAQTGAVAQTDPAQPY